MTMEKLTKEQFEHASKYFDYAVNHLSDMQHNLYELCYCLRQTKYKDAEILGEVFDSFKKTLDDWQSIVEGTSTDFAIENFDEEWKDEDDE